MASVSIILIAYNDQTHVSAALQSACSQTWQDVEIICVDDGSSDRTLEIMRQAASKDSRVRVFTQANNGCFSARFLGLQNATGEYVMFLDSDDLLLPEAVETLLKEAKRTRADVLEFGVEVVGDESNPINAAYLHYLSSIFSADRPLPSVDCGYVLINECFDRRTIAWNIWNKLYRISLVKEAWQYYHGEYITMAEDMLETLMILCRARRYARIDTKLYRYQVMSGMSVTQNAIDSAESVKRYGMEALLFRLQREWMEKLPEKPTDCETGIAAFRREIRAGLFSNLLFRCVPEKKDEMLRWIKRCLTQEEFYQELQEFGFDNQRKIDDKETHIKNLETLLTVRNEAVEDKERHIRNLEAKVQVQSGIIEDKEHHIRDLEAQVQIRSGTIEDKERHIRNLEAQVQIQSGTIEDKERHIRNLEAQVQVQSGAIEDKEHHIRNLGARIKAQDEVIAEKEHDIRNLHSMIGEVVTRIEQRDKLIAEQSERLSDRNRQLAEAKKRENQQKGMFREQEAELAHYKEHYFAAINQREDLKRQLAQAQYAYDVISNAAFWKITKPFRWTLDGIKSLCRRSRFLRLVGKVRKCWRENGSRYTYRKIKNRLCHRHDFMLASQPSYTEDQLAAQRRDLFPRDILFSILVPIYDTPEAFLHEMIRSVQDQTYEKWELCLADGSDEKHADVGRICHQYAARDSRIRYRKLEKNLGISGNTNVCIDMAKGDYFALFDHDDILHPAALHEVMKAICEQDADFIYTDETTFHNKPEDAYQPHFKPEFAPDSLRGINYICHLTVFRRSLLDEVGRFDPACDGSQDHDLVLRLTEKAKCIVHIPQILYYWRAHTGSVAEAAEIKPYVVEAGIRAVTKQLERLGLEGEVSLARSGLTVYRVRYAIKGTPKVSILIPNCEHLADLRKCLESIFNKTTYTDYEIVIVENNSTSLEVFAYYHLLEQAHKNVKVVEWQGKFNFSAINNYGSRFCTGEYLLLLNNDIEVITPDWLQELLMFAQREDVGAVGAMLYYPDDTVQHAGVILGIGGVGGHAHKYFPRGDYGYMSRLTYAQDMSAVTAACLMTRKAVWDEIGGLDEDFEVAFNDVDLCMRIRKAGYLIVWTPFAELYHCESKSRGLEDTPEKQKRFEGEVLRFQARWAKELTDGDPYYNPNLTLEREDFSLR